jgi:hypothetical protein
MSWLALACLTLQNSIYKIICGIRDVSKDLALVDEGGLDTCCLIDTIESEVSNLFKSWEGQSSNNITSSFIV